MSITTLISSLPTIFVDQVSDKPACEPWSLLPTLFVVFGLILVNIFFFVGKRIRQTEKHDLWFNIIVFCTSLTFAGLETYIEVTQYLHYGQYDWTTFPLQFCTVPMFLGFAIPFIKNDKVKLSIVYFVALFSTISGVFPLILGQPQLCRWPTLFGVARSFIWHILLLCLAFFMIGYCGIGTNWKQERKYILGSFGVFFLITVFAEITNVCLHYYGGINYPAPIDPETGVAMKQASTALIGDPDSASCFYISPYFRSNPVVYCDIWLYCGWFINYILYVISFSLGAFIVYLIVKFVRSSSTKIIHHFKKEDKTEAVIA